MAEERDRTKRYANPPKQGKKGGMQNKEEKKAAGEAKTAEHKEAAGKGPTDEKPGKVGKVGEDKGPEGGHSATMGVMHERHKTEHAATVKRHGEEGTAMHERHGKELKDMMGRHHKEMADHMEAGAEAKIEATAGKPKELGKAKDEGKKGSEP
jgi:hypothetical protein